jgi:hypothetical protein
MEYFATQYFLIELLLNKLLQDPLDSRKYRVIAANHYACYRKLL